MSLEMIMMDGGEEHKGKCSGDAAVKPDLGKNLEVQLVLSLAIGISAFFLFCVCPSILERAVQKNSDSTWY
jgi:hypothetical protein